LLAIDGQFHHKVVNECFAADVIRSLGEFFLDWRFEDRKVRAEFVLGNLFSGTIGEVYFKGHLAEMIFKIFSVRDVESALL